MVNFLRVEIDRVSVLRRQTIEQFSQGAFGTVLPIHEGRNYGDAHVSRLARADNGCFSAEVVRMGARFEYTAEIPERCLRTDGECAQG